MKRPAAKPGCFHTCLTGVLKLYGLNNEAHLGNVLAGAQTPVQNFRSWWVPGLFRWLSRSRLFRPW